MRFVCSLLLALLALCAFSPPASAQTSVVAKYRVNYPTPLGPDNSVKLLKQVAFEVKGGIYKKTTGNNCNGYSCDIICFSDGRGYDVLVDATGAATPAWQGPVPGIDSAKCELVTTDPSGSAPPNTPPTTDPADPSAAERLKNIDINVAEIRRLLTLAAGMLGIH
jgi:hypothetical protein